ncbi:MAG: YitT family protein [candidate division WOR-3 bacterium]
MMGWATDKRVRQNLRDIVLVTLGAALCALSYVLFLIPHHIVPGGVTGIAMLLNYLLRTPVGLVTIVINIPLFIWGLREIGRPFVLKSFLGMLLSSFFIDVLTYVVRLHTVTESRILAAIYGGILLGSGLGLVFRGNGSTGGSDIIGQILSHRSNLSTGMAIMLVDFLVISFSAVTFSSIEAALYGYGTLFLSTRVLDFVIEGWSYARALFIITEKPEVIIGALTGDLGRGATRLSGKGGFTGLQRDVIYCVVAKREVSLIKRYIKSIDPGAFVVISDVYEVLGEGFRPRA